MEGGIARENVWNQPTILEDLNTYDLESLHLVHNSVVSADQCPMTARFYTLANVKQVDGGEQSLIATNHIPPHNVVMEINGDIKRVRRHHGKGHLVYKGLRETPLYVNTSITMAGHIRKSCFPNCTVKHTFSTSNTGRNQLVLLLVTVKEVKNEEELMLPFDEEDFEGSNETWLCAVHSCHPSRCRGTRSEVVTLDDEPLVEEQQERDQIQNTPSTSNVSQGEEDDDIQVIEYPEQSTPSTSRATQEDDDDVQILEGPSSRSQLKENPRSTYSPMFRSFLETVPRSLHSDVEVKKIRQMHSTQLPYRVNSEPVTHLRTLDGTSYKKDTPILEVHGQFLMSNEVDWASQDSQSLLNAGVKDLNGLKWNVSVRAPPGDVHRMRRSCRPNCHLKLFVEHEIGFVVCTRKSLCGNTELTIPFDQFCKESTSPLKCARHADPRDCQKEVDRLEHHEMLRRRSKPQIREVEEEPQSNSQREASKRGSGQFQYRRDWSHSRSPSPTRPINNQRSPPSSRGHGNHRSRSRPEQQLWRPSRRLNGNRSHHSEGVPRDRDLAQDQRDDSDVIAVSPKTAPTTSGDSEDRQQSSDRRRSSQNHVDRNRPRSRLPSRHVSRERSVERTPRYRGSSRSSSPSRRQRCHRSARSERKSRHRSKRDREARKIGHDAQGSAPRSVQESGAEDSSHPRRSKTGLEYMERSRDLPGMARQHPSSPERSRQEVVSSTSEIPLPSDSRPPARIEDQTMRVVNHPNGFSLAFQRYLPTLQAIPQYNRDVGTIKSSVMPIKFQSTGLEVTKHFGKGEVVMKLNGYFGMIEDLKDASFVIRTTDGQSICLQTQDTNALRIRRSCEPTCELSLAVANEVVLLVVAKEDIPRGHQLLLPFNSDWKTSKTPLLCGKHQGNCELEKERKNAQLMDMATRDECPRETEPAEVRLEGRRPSSHRPMDLVGNPSSEDPDNHRKGYERRNSAHGRSKPLESWPSAAEEFEANARLRRHQVIERNERENGNSTNDRSNWNSKTSRSSDSRKVTQQQSNLPKMGPQRLPGLDLRPISVCDDYDGWEEAPRPAIRRPLPTSLPSPSVPIQSNLEARVAPEVESEVEGEDEYEEEEDEQVLVAERVEAGDDGEDEYGEEGPVVVDSEVEGEDEYEEEEPVEDAKQDVVSRTLSDEDGDQETEVQEPARDNNRETILAEDAHVTQTPAVEEAEESSGGEDVQVIQDEAPEDVRGIIQNGVEGNGRLVADAVEQEFQESVAGNSQDRQMDAQDFEPDDQLQVDDRVQEYEGQAAEQIQEEVSRDIQHKFTEEDPASAGHRADEEKDQVGEPSTSNSSSEPSELVSSENTQTRAQVPMKQDSGTKKTKKDISSPTPQPTTTSDSSKTLTSSGSVDFPTSSGQASRIDENLESENSDSDSPESSSAPVRTTRKRTSTATTPGARRKKTKKDNAPGSSASQDAPSSSKRKGVDGKWDEVRENSFTPAANVFVNDLDRRELPADFEMPDEATVDPRMHKHKGPVRMITLQRRSAGEQIMEVFGAISMASEEADYDENLFPCSTSADGLLESTIVIRPTNKARFFRHSCKPNAVLEHFKDSNGFKVIVKAREKISQMTEVTLPFASNYKESTEPLKCALHSLHRAKCEFEKERRETH